MHGAALRWWETTYTTVAWDYPPSPAAHHDALLARGASHSRFLRIAYLSTTSPSSTTPSRPDSPHALPCSLSRSCMHVRPRSTNPASHILKRRKPQWPKPPHYHASLLRSPLSHRKGLFRALLPPNKAVDFFRWDILVGTGVSLSASRRERDQASQSDGDACASLHVAESVLEPYEAAAGFFGWHGLGVIRRADEDECCWCQEPDLERDGVSSDLRLEMDEAVVEEARTRWIRSAEELVGPPGLALRRVVENDRSSKVTLPSDLAHKDVVDARPTSVSSRRAEARWDSDVGSNPFRSPRATSVSGEKKPPNFKPELKPDSSSAWWHGTYQHRGPPPTPLRFLPPPPVQYGPPPVQFSPWFPGGSVASTQGHGYWYGAQTVGAASPMNRDPNLAKPLSPHSYIFATPATPNSIRPAQSPPYPTKPSLDRGKYGPDHDCDKEIETDHGYESTTTTTDSDPPPHTPVGAATSHCVEALQLHGDDEAEVYGVEIDVEHAAASVTVNFSDPTTPVKHLGRFSMSTSPSALSGSPVSDRGSCESSKAVVTFPSLNGSFRQGSSQTSAPLTSPGMSAQTTPAGTMTPGNAFTMQSTIQLSPDDDKDPRVKIKRRSLESTVCPVSGDSPTFKLNLCSPPLTSSRPGLRKDSQGFWEPVTPVSPSSSSSSLPISPFEAKVGPRPMIKEKTEPGPGESSESSEVIGSPSTPSAMSRSLSSGPRPVTSAGSTRSSSSWPTSFSFSSPASACTSVFGGSYPSSPSPPNGSSLVPPNPTTLLPAFLATATVKRKKASRTREIVDRLKSSSIDAGKGGAGLDGLGWLASSDVSGGVDGKLGKTSSEHAAGNHVAKGQPSPSPSPPSQSGAASASRVGSELGKKDQAPGSTSLDSGSSGSGRMSNGATPTVTSSSEYASSRVATTSPKLSITPFPILSVSQASASGFATTRQSQTGGTSGQEPMVSTLSKGADGPRMNAAVAMSPSARSSGPQLVPSTPNDGTSPSARPSHHPLPSLSHPTVHSQPPLGPPAPILAVPYPHPVYVPFTQYRVAPPHQVQQGQGTWLAVYPGRPPHLPVHPVPTQTHIPPITGVSGMRHASW